MPIEYAVTLRAEFIPAGASRGPVKELHFKILKAGTCSVLGGILGFPTLDVPATPGGEGLGWRNTPRGAEYTSLGVTLPRTDDVRKKQYLTGGRVHARSKGEAVAITSEC